MARSMAHQADLDPQFILDHAGFVRSLARGLLRDEALVDDVVQETLVRALEKGPRRREALGAWLRTVTRNIAFKTYRGTARRSAREEEAAKPERLPAAFDLVAKGETLEKLTSAVLELPETAREIILLRYYEGLSNAEIAERLGIGVGAVRMRVHRAQAQLKTALDRSSDGDRSAWMAGIAALAGLSVKDLRLETAHAAAGTGLSGAALLMTAMIGIAFGMLLWFAAPGFGPRAAGSAVEIDRAIADAVPPAAIDLAGTDERDDQRFEPGLGGRFGAGATSLAATTEAVDEVPEEFPEGNLVGTVVDHDGEPVANARVSAAWGRHPIAMKAETNDEGRFGVEVPEAILQDAKIGKYPILLAAWSNGHAPSRVWAWPEEFSDEEPGPDGPRARLSMRGGSGTLVGFVRGSSGGVLSGARLEIGERTRFGLGFLGYQSAESENHLAPSLAARVERGDRLVFKGNRDMRGTLGRHVLDADGHRTRLQPARRGRTRGDGSYHFGGLEPGVQRVRITAPGHAAWNGFVDVARGTATSRNFVLDAEATVVGTLTTEDGLPLGRSLVHAIQAEPWNATTVLVADDGTYAIGGLRPGPARIVAEERAPGKHTPPRIAQVDVDLVAGATRPLDLELHAVPTRLVRFVLRDGADRRPLAGQEVQLRGVHNPLLTVASVTTDESGLAAIPTETVVPCQWLLVGDAAWRKKGSDGHRIPVSMPVAVVEPPAAFRAPTPHRRASAPIPVVLDADTLSIATVRLTIESPGGDRTAQDAVLVPEHGLFNMLGKPSGGPGTLTFKNVPAGRYHVLVPYHGLGWVAPGPLVVPASGLDATVDLGRIRVPPLGAVELRPSTELEGSRTLDLQIQTTQSGRQLRVFEGRVEVPATIPLAPGRYVLSTGRVRDPYVREIVVSAGQSVDVLWPVD